MQPWRDRNGRVLPTPLQDDPSWWELSGVAREAVRLAMRTVAHPGTAHGLDATTEERLAQRLIRPLAQRPRPADQPKRTPEGRAGGERASALERRTSSHQNTTASERDAGRARAAALAAAEEPPDPDQVLARLAEALRAFCSLVPSPLTVERVAAGRLEIRAEPAAGSHRAPLLVVQLVAAGVQVGRLQQRVDRWLGTGTERVWLLDPATGVVTVHRASRSPRWYSVPCRVPLEPWWLDWGIDLTALCDRPAGQLLVPLASAGDGTLRLRR
ncbi:hypothetical protein HRbin27_00626 [bacterium HR27]|nr:hypothetical protein HRbin27_00626 [bacterium HR27]